VNLPNWQFVFWQKKLADRLGSYVRMYVFYLSTFSWIMNKGNGMQDDLDQTLGVHALWVHKKGMIRSIRYTYLLLTKVY
jgi:hypothetical protein